MVRAARIGLAVGLFMGVTAAIAAPAFAVPPMVGASPEAARAMEPAPPSIELQSRPRIKKHRVLFMNRSGGHYVQPPPGSPDDGPHNQSIYAPAAGGSNMPPYGGTDMDWTQLLACAKITYAPFDLEVTDVRPPDTTDFLTINVGGAAHDTGLDDTMVGGISPSICITNERAVAYYFSGSDCGIGGLCDTARQCAVVAQESAHALGLEHEYLCEDPMSYLDNCSPSKSFQDRLAQCGTYNPADCSCMVNAGSKEQNSVQALLAVLGRPDDIPPTITVDSPEDGATVPPGFEVDATATDNLEVSKVEVLIDGVAVPYDSVAPYQVKTPVDVTLGAHALLVRAFDPHGNMAVKALMVTVAPACAADADCGADRQCMGNRCVSTLGGTCTVGSDCGSNTCVTAASGDKFCSQFCSASDSNSCPSAFDCVAPSLGKSRCEKATGGGGGCAAAPGRLGGLGAWLGGLLAATGLLLSARRRRAR